jgi:hypothetical protein
MSHTQSTSGDLAYFVAAGPLRYQWAAWWAVRALRRLAGFEGKIVVLSDRHYAFGDGAQCITVSVARQVEEAKRLKLRARQHIDFSAYRRVMFLDSDLVATHSLSAVLNRAEQENALVATDDLKHCIGDGFTYRCLDPGEIELHRQRPGVNSGFFVAPGRFLAEWLTAWEGVLDATRERVGPGFDQPGLNACMVRNIFPIALEPELMWFPQIDPEKKLCAANPSLIHFHGIGRHLNRFWRMRTYIRQRLAEQ